MNPLNALDTQNNNLQNEANDESSCQADSHTEARLEDLVNQRVSRRGLLGITGQGVLGLATLALFKAGGSPALAGSGRTNLERMLPGAIELKRPLAAQPAPRMTAFADDSPLTYYSNLPQWGDGQKFNQPQYYETICVGDVDGDGQDELIIRGPAGMHIERFDPPSGQWLTLTTAGPMLSDAAGWNDPKYYRTIQCTKVDYDAQDEIVVRGPNGIVAYKYDHTFGSDTYQQFVELKGGFGPFSDAAANGIWTQEPHYSTIKWGKNPSGNGLHYVIGRNADGLETWYYAAEVPGWFYPNNYKGPWQDNDTTTGTNWTLPQYYETIQFGDIDGDGRDELIGRSARGIEVYKFNTGTGDHNWALLATNTGIMTDAQGWNKPEYYTTIQCADIDGDGTKELLARSSTGIVAFKYNTATHGFDPMLSGPGLRDSDGWNLAEIYETLRFGDIDGDGAEEMIIRDAGGILIYKYYPNFQGFAGPRWVEMSAGAPRNPQWRDDSTGPDSNWTHWNQVEYYSTIRFARTHADEESRRFYNGNTSPVYDSNGQEHTAPYATLVARDNFGIQTWRYHPYTFTLPWEGGYFIRTSAGPVDFTSDTNVKNAYIALDKALRPDSYTGNIREIYNNTLANLAGYMAQLYKTPSDILNQNQTCLIAPPADIDNGAWQDVTWQVYWEMSYVVAVNAWFVSLGNFVDEITIGKSLTVNTIRDYLDIPQSSKSSFVMSILSLIFNGAWAVLGYPGIAEAGSEFEKLPGQLSALSGIMATVFSGAALISGDDGSWQGVIAGLEAALENAFTEAKADNGVYHQSLTGGIVNASYLPMDYGLLAAIGKQINWASTYNPWVWKSDMVEVETQTQRAYAIQIWQTLSVVSGWCILYDPYHEVKNPSYPYNYADTKSYPHNPYWLGDKNYSFAQNQDQLWQKPANQSDIWPLGIPQSDVFEANNGWPVLRLINWDSPPAPNAVLTMVPSLKADLQVTVMLTRNAVTGILEAELKMVNRGLAGATNVELVSVQLANRPAIEPLPHHRTRIAEGAEWKATVKFPADTAQAGQTVVLRIQGKYKGGTFGGSYRIKIS